MRDAASSPVGTLGTSAERAGPGPRAPVELWPLAAGLLLLALLWFGPLPDRARGSFAAHMVMHMGVVAVAAPLLAVGIARAFPRLVASFPPGLALAASLLEFAAVWTWHAPALHDAARAETAFLVLEQASFLAAGVLVWASAVGAPGDGRLAARGAGVCALLITSMHMVLLGALLLFAPRPLYACAEVCSPAAALTPLGDQQLGGALMLIIGGTAYLAGGLALLSSVLRDRAPTGETA
ncbi:cytochrome c oxidase assembly protein [Skermanella pratensis]|uniref:cytochrome c oxidase assembly protein n=1 Tax=Skermanella pratensis TaxID=2233999 RepID=UPI0013019444|nr:cytochrome c oxidase assembly protein [Skermanella pratensis]